MDPAGPQQLQKFNHLAQSETAESTDVSRCLSHRAVSSETHVEFVLASIKSAVHRIDEIRQELINAGLALKGRFITPQMALDWAEEFAPGCIGYVPPESGLKVKGPLKVE